jgi:hypothetical protein
VTCPRCSGAYLAADPECPRCGLPLSATAAAPVSAQGAARTTTSSSERPWIVRGSAVVGVLVCVFAALTYLGIGEEDEDANWRPNDLPAEISTSPGDGGLSTGQNIASTASVSADRTANPAEDDAGNTITYEAAHMVDGDPETTWRATGYYQNEYITITLPAPTQIQVVGLTNGYTKIDATSGRDRYKDGRRIRSVTWTFDGGNSVTQSLEDNVREIQYKKIDPVQAQTIRLRINQTTTPGNFQDDYTAITELFVSAG